jgi:hypothetical protein
MMQADRPEVMMGHSLVSGAETCCQSAGKLAAAHEVFEQAAAEFIARPQRRCNFERLASAAVALHDAGLADLEHRYGRGSGSFGGRMSPDEVAGQVCSDAAKRFAGATGKRKPSTRRRPGCTSDRGTEAEPSGG